MVTRGLVNSRSVKYHTSPLSGNEASRNRAMKIDIFDRRGFTVLHSLHAESLIGADLSGIDLTNANLVALDLQGVKLRNTLLAHADLRLANLRGADFTGADLSHANLQDADLTGACLDGARLSLANFTGVVGLDGAPLVRQENAE